MRQPGAPIPGRTFRFPLQHGGRALRVAAPSSSVVRRSARRDPVCARTVPAEGRVPTATVRKRRDGRTRPRPAKMGTSDPCREPGAPSWCPSWHTTPPASCRSPTPAWPRTCCAGSSPDGGAGVGAGAGAGGGRAGGVSAGAALRVACVKGCRADASPGVVCALLAGVSRPGLRFLPPLSRGRRGTTASVKTTRLAEMASFPRKRESIPPGNAGVPPAGGPQARPMAKWARRFARGRPRSQGGTVGPPARAYGTQAENMP